MDAVRVILFVGVLALAVLLFFVGLATALKWLYGLWNGGAATPQPAPPAAPVSARAPVPAAPVASDASAVPDSRSPRPFPEPSPGASPGPRAEASPPAALFPPSYPENVPPLPSPSKADPGQPEPAMTQTPAPPPPPLPSPLAGLPRDSLFLRYALVALIALVLFIPLTLVESLVHGRASLYRDVVRDISRTWGGEQTLSGPYLLLPYTHRVSEERIIPVEGKDYGRKVNEVRLETGTFVVLPAQVSFKADLVPEERQRGIYRTQVYTAALDVQGHFVLPDEEALLRIVPSLAEVDFAHAFVVMGLTYPSALRTAGPFVWDGAPLTAEPGTQPFHREQLGSGFRVPLRIAWHPGEFAFSQRLVFTGSGGIRFSPAGETTDISVASPWPHPSFQGSVLPVSHEVTQAGFSAVWSVPSLARSYPNLGKLDAWKGALDDFSVGVDIYETSTHYKLVERSVKYGILFIGLTFLTFVVFELGLGSRLHPVQYGIVGLSLVIFYLALLSLAEHVSFLAAYVGAAGCILLMASLYVGAALRSVRQGLGLAVLLAALYALLYTILQMEDYALLMGTALILVMLAALMTVSRNLGWASRE